MSEVKFCKDCIHANTKMPFVTPQGTTYPCRRHVVEVIKDVVTGDESIRDINRDCRTERGDEWTGCGRAAKFFQPKHKETE